MEYIKCEKCGVKVERTGGRQLYCNVCKKTVRNETVKRYYNRNKKQQQLKAVEHYHNNKEYYKKQNKEYSKTPKKKYNTYKNSAKYRNIKFNIDFDTFMSFWRKPCYFCNAEIPTIGIDRIDNNKGYQKNNIIPCCKVCNSMKSKMTISQFINQCKIILKHTNYGVE